MGFLFQVMGKSGLAVFLLKWLEPMFHRQIYKRKSKRKYSTQIMQILQIFTDFIQPRRGDIFVEKEKNILNPVSLRPRRGVKYLFEFIHCDQSP